MTATAGATRFVDLSRGCFGDLEVFAADGMLVHIVDANRLERSIADVQA